MVSDLRQVGGFLQVHCTPVSSTNKTDRHDVWNIVESGVKHHKPTNQGFHYIWTVYIFVNNPLSLLVIFFRLKGEFTGTDGQGVDYEKLKLSQQFKEYEEITPQLQNVELDGLSENDKKAFFISILFIMSIDVFVLISLKVDSYLICQDKTTI